MWQFQFSLDRRPGQCLFRQIASALVDDIKRGRLRPGDRLPGTRTLAAAAGVNRVTVLAAYDELTAEGWLSTHATRGTFVANDLPIVFPKALRTAPARADVAVAPRWLPPVRGVLNFRSSYPDTRLVRLEPLARAYRRVLVRSGGALLGYGAPEGHPRLREAIAEMLRRTRALSVAADDILISRGSQMALSLVARTLVRPGDVVAVEHPGYRYAWDAFHQAGATLAPVSVDRHGIDISALAALVAQTRVAAVYVTPHHQLPTAVTLEAERRARLIEIARAHRLTVIEDDYDHEFHFDGKPIAPLASHVGAPVIYIGTLSKVLAPGIRIGYVVAPAATIAQLAALRQTIDMHGDPAVEAAVAELIEEEELQRHVRRVSRIYRARRDLLAALLEQLPGAPLQFDVPAGGIAIWARASPDVNVDAWAAASLRRGAAFLTGRAFAFDDAPLPFVRLGFACLNEVELRQAVSRMAAALPEARALKTVAANQ